MDKIADLQENNNHPQHESPVLRWLGRIKKLKEIFWVQQLMEASQGSARTITLLATGVVNIVSLAFPLALMQVYDRIIPNRSYSTLFLLFAGVIVALLFEMFLRILRATVNLWNDAKYEYTMGKSAFQKLTNISLQEYGEMGAGARLQQLSVLDYMRGFYNNQLLSTLFDVPFALIFIAVVAYIGGLLALVPLFFMICLIYITIVFYQYSKDYVKEKFMQEARENNFLLEVIENIHTVKSMGMENLFLSRYEHLQTSGVFVNYHAAVESSDLATTKLIASQLIVALMVALGAIDVIHGEMTLGGLTACSLLAGRIIQPMHKGLGTLSRLQVLNLAWEQINALMSIASEKKSNGLVVKDIQGDIKLKNVHFAYGDQENQILTDINLTIPAHSIVGINGKEQSGKTTLLNILSTNLLPTSGQYFIDDHAVNEYNLDELRQKITYISRLSELFLGTIMDNLSAFDEKQIPVASRLTKILGLDEVIAKLPNGFETIVGNRVVDTFSQGVIQRIAMARALAHEPKVVLFDETNMSFDSETDSRIRTLLPMLTQVATVIIVSHRIPILTLASVVYELKEGRLK